MTFSDWIGQTRTFVVADIKSLCHLLHGIVFWHAGNALWSRSKRDRSLRLSLIVDIGCSCNASVITDISGAECFTVFISFYGRAVLSWTTTLRVVGIAAAKRYPLITTITFVELITNAKIDTAPIIHHPRDGIHTSLLSLVQRLKRRQTYVPARCSNARFTIDLD